MSAESINKKFYSTKTMTHYPIQAREISACLINSEKNKTPGQEVKAAQITEIYTKIDKNAHNYGKEFYQLFLIRQNCSFHIGFQAYL